MVHLLNSYVDSMFMSCANEFCGDHLCRLSLLTVGYVAERVVIMTTDGRMLIGTLINSDNQANIVRFVPPILLLKHVSDLFSSMNIRPGSNMQETPIDLQILYNVTERHIAPADGDEDSVDRPSVGTEIIRGSTILVVGLVDEELEGSIDWTKVRGEPIGDTYNA